MEVGYCRAYRKAWTHPIFKDLLDAAIWNFLYQNAFYDDGLYAFNGKLHEVKRGQIVTSIRHLAAGFRVSERSVKRVFETLVTSKSISIEVQRRETVVTISNYDKYQPLVKSECSTEAEPKQNRSSTGAAPLYNDENKGIKELRNKEKEKKYKKKESLFEEFWESYGRIGNKQPAKKAYEKIMNEGVSHAKIIEGLGRYQRYCRAINQEQRFIKHASTWLNNRGWEDDYKIYSIAGNGGSAKPTRSDYEEAAIRGAIRAENPDF